MILQLSGKGMFWVPRTSSSQLYVLPWLAICTFTEDMEWSGEPSVSSCGLRGRETSPLNSSSNIICKSGANYGKNMEEWTVTYD